jgi:hypothetical protein
MRDKSSRTYIINGKAGIAQQTIVIKSSFDTVDRLKKSMLDPNTFFINSTRLLGDSKANDQ